jgi:predicted lipoprotein with Yx(FWY)xxD motif
MNAFPLAPKLLSTAAIIAVLGLAACGGSDDNGDSATAATSSTGGETVGVSEIDGAQVLVDANGNALYSPDQEANGKISCTGECETIWMPLTASGGSKPTSSSDVTGTVGTVKRPDGSMQVTLDGAPLYTFSEDGGPGKVTGDGFSDQFDGKSFTWHVIAPDGSAGSTESSPQTTTSSSSGGYSY